jgi:fumarylacetoacetate (FAA) hydrolase
VQLELHVAWNGRPFGHPHTGAMHYSFGALIAHAARTRRLRAGTIIGSGTISNVSPEAGCACIAERRALEVVEHGSARTPFLAFGDRVRMEARAPGVTRGPFGIIEQRIVPAVADRAPHEPSGPFGPVTRHESAAQAPEGAEPRKE